MVLADGRGSGPAPDDRHEQLFAEGIERRQRRKLAARRRRKPGAWFGLGMFGLVGWSVAIPILVGLALGLWIDSRGRGGISWTLVLLGAGVILGCANAYFWIVRERRSMEEERESDG